MEKLQICRVCLAKNVRMFKVNDKNFQELYETLTDIPFVSEDRRPMLACVFCFAKLKQCCQLQRKCLEAEKLFAQMLNEPNTSVSRAQLKLSSELVVTHVENISISDVSHVERIAVKEELPDVCERLDDVSEPKAEHLKYELELEPLNNRSHAEHVPAQQSKPVLEYDVPLIEIKKEVEEEQEEPRKKRRVSDTTQIELENVNRSYSEYVPAQSESDSEDDVPLVEIKTEVEEEQEVPRKKRRVSDATRAAVAKKRNPHIRGKKLEDVITEIQKKNEESNIKVTQNTPSGSSELIAKYQEPSTNISVTVDTNYSNNIIKDNETKHIRMYTGEEPYKCEVCHICFIREEHLTKHVRIHAREKPFKCEQCQRCFSRKDYLTRHIRTHTGEKPFKCDECQRGFIQKIHLTRHIRSHTGYKPYKCEQCQVFYSQKGDLTSHIRAHAGEKPFKCEQCQRCFSQKVHLTNHIRTHTGEKPYKCEECQLCFSVKTTLLCHIRTHTGEKPYKCEQCQLCFSQRASLLRHVQTHTGEKPYKCEECNLRFRCKQQLTRHVGMHTGEKPSNC